MQEIPKIIARQNGETRVRRHGRIGRARLLVDDCHFAKELAVMQVGQRCVVAIGVFDTDADAPGFDEIHRVAGIAALEKRCAARGFAHGEQIAQLEGGAVVQITK